VSDRRLRELERLREAGDRPAAVRLLRERLRSGDLDPERLALLAYVGDEVAAEALGEAAPRPSRDLESWLRGLARWGRPAFARAATAAARLVLPFWELTAPEDARPREAIAAAEACLADPGAPAAEEARARAEAAQHVLGELAPRLLLSSDPSYMPTVMARAFRETRAAVQAALAAAAPDPAQAVRHAVLAGVAARERMALEEVPRGPGGRALHARAEQVDRLGQLPELDTPSAAARVRTAAEEALRPWARAEAGVA